MGLALQVFGVAWGFGVSGGASGFGCRAFGSVSPTSSGITTHWLPAAFSTCQAQGVSDVGVLV